MSSLKRFIGFKVAGSVAWLLLTTLITMFSTLTLATELSELQRDGRVSLTASLSASDSVAVHQQVTVNIEIMTDTWFTKGTKVHRFDVENALVLSSSRFAINSTERIKGKTFSKQQWEVVLYPLKSGEYLIPRITAEIEVKDGHQKVSGYLTSDPLSFHAHKPAAEMTDDYLWLVSPDVNIKQEWHVVRAGGEAVEQSVDIQVGDSITRTVTTTAKNTSVMLLPDLLEKSRVPQHIASRYALEPKRMDSQNRGENVAIKVETVTYVANRPGQLAIPTITLHQWDNESKQTHDRVIQGRTWKVGHTFGSLISFYRFHLAIGLSLLAFCVYLAKRIKNRFLNQALPNSLLYLIHARNENTSACETLIYKELLEKYRCYRMPKTTFSSTGTDSLVRARYMADSEPAAINKVAWLKLWFHAFQGVTKQRNKR